MIAVTLIAVAGVVGIAAPAQAAPSDRWGFAFVDDPLAPVWTNLDPAHQATSPAGPPVQGGRLGTGRFAVKFAAIGAGARGNVHVTAVSKKGTSARPCAGTPRAPTK